MARNTSWHPPRSPWGLIQEDLYPDEWKCIVVCILLNCTSRKQIEKILSEFFHRWPGPTELCSEDPSNIESLISCLGFGKRRTTRLLEMSSKYLKGDWKHVSELPGVGEYATRMWEIFFQGKIGDEPPNDGALKLYWYWMKLRDWKLLADQEIFDAIPMDEERQKRTSPRYPGTQPHESSFGVEGTTT